MRRKDEAEEVIPDFDDDRVKEQKIKGDELEDYEKDDYREIDKLDDYDY